MTDTALPGMPPAPPLIVELYGEDGEVAIAEGHRDKQAFLTALIDQADFMALDLKDFTEADVEHGYWRDATVFDGEVAFEDGWKFWDAHAGNGQPITMLKLDR